MGDGTDNSEVYFEMAVCRVGGNYGKSGHAGMYISQEVCCLVLVLKVELLRIDFELCILHGS